MTIVDQGSAFSEKLHGPDIQETIEAPRVRVCADRTVDVEARMPMDELAALEAPGHAIRLVPDCEVLITGGSGLVAFTARELLPFAYRVE